jgi:subtilisin family serine protease
LLVQSGNARAEVEAAGFDVARELAGGDVLQVVGPDDKTQLDGIGGVQHVVRNAYIGLDAPEFEELHADEFDEPPMWQYQWDKQVTDVAAAHDVATGDGSTVAILDTGIDPDHPDLVANLNHADSQLFSSGNPIDDNPWDSNGHGTHVAGIAAASGDVGVLGTAPDAELVSLKVFWYEDPSGHPDEDEPFMTTTTADILAAIDAAAALGADAANMSLGTPPLPPQFNQYGFKVAYERVIQHANTQGTVVVASAGNSAANLQQGGYFTTPNSTAGALSVSATGPNDKLAFYSNYGTNEIDLGAPGGGYETLEKTLNEDPTAVEWPFPLNLVFSTYPGGYAWLAGTSMAAPQVTGAVALIRDLAPGANVHQVESALKHGAEGTNGKSDPALGAGRLNAANSLTDLQ